MAWSNEITWNRANVTDEWGESYGDGGGVGCWRRPPLIANCVISNNTAKRGVGGGVLYFAYETGYELLMVDCDVQYNQQEESTGYGGGVYAATRPAAGSGSFRMIGGSVTGNIAQAMGAGIYVSGNYVEMRNVTVQENKGIRVAQEIDPWGGGLFNQADACLIQGCRFIGNQAVAGAGIWSNQPTDILDCEIRENICDAALGDDVPKGGGMFLDHAASETHTSNILRCLISGNGGPNCDHGGGIALEWSTQMPEPKIKNCLFTRNSAGGASIELGGGAVFVQDANTEAVNNTFVENWAGPGVFPDIVPRAYGGAIHLYATSLSMTAVINNIFYGNLADFGDSAAFTGPSGGSVTHCMAYPGDQGDNYFDQYGGVTFTDLWPDNPLFCEMGAGNYRLQEDPQPSPARDVGLTPTQDDRVPEDDIEGNLRPGEDGYTDLGAYEDVLCQ